MAKIKSKLSELTDRVWLRISKKNNQNLTAEALQNGRSKGAQNDLILSKHYGDE